ncbi:sensor histidine kinase [bacterium 1xD8-6]|nr:HAMP domain-containing sensor histidine kinase [Lachnospiraceae bacterium]RKI26383.1 sensor histidine kinase [bacterium D16-36]RKI68486.1 sensor histidine kinase [bacterium 1xD8-6]
MGKIRTKSLKMSMAVTFLITICVIGVLSGLTVFTANQAQHEILKNRPAIIRNPKITPDKATGGYIIDISENQNIWEWQELSTKQNIIYYGSYAAMIGLPVVYIVGGIGIATMVYYKRKLRIPIAQLQNGIKRIQENDLDFCIEYNGGDELGQLCGSMEKMRKELRQNNKALWEALEQRKLLNASVAHDLRTPITVLKGYLDYLEDGILQDKLTEDKLLDTVLSMQGAVTRLEQYAECVRNLEKIENIEIKIQPENVKLLIKEIESNISQLTGKKEILFSDGISFDEVNIDKGVLFRILENLLQNALRYAEKQINISITQNDKFLILTVKDDGKGFTETDLKKADTMFYSKDRGKEHFGIGLGICKILCEKHGGRLLITNNKEKGACVIAKLKIL